MIAEVIARPGMMVVTIVESLEQERKNGGMKSVQLLCFIGVERVLVHEQVLSMNRIDDAARDFQARIGLTSKRAAKLRHPGQKVALGVAKTVFPPGEKNSLCERGRPLGVRRARRQLGTGLRQRRIQRQ